MLNISSSSIPTGIIVKFIVDYLVKAPWFPWVDGTKKTQVLALAGAVSALSGVVIAWASGSISEDVIQSLLDAVGNAITVFSASVGTHEVTKDRPINSTN